MKNSEKLKNLIELEILPDVEIAIDELFEVISKTKNANSTQKEELEELREMRTEFYAIIEDVTRNEIEEDEVDALLEELMDMKSEEE
ncbi:MAG: hypothetical protein U9R27_12070 [Campylobacterota bacterium]|nr:hypothetical protein [Campylobacterota bacterium]